MSRGENFVRRQSGGHEPVPATYRGFMVGVQPFLNRPPLERNSEVAITRAFSYSQAEDAVREAIHLLGGASRFCGKGDQVMLKPNLVLDTPPELAETTHPAVVYAVVKVLKETGATVRVGERAGLDLPTDRAFENTGIKKAALDAGADEVVDWSKDEYVDVDVPDGRSFAKVAIPKSLYDSNVYVDVPKFKNNWILGSGALTLTIKSMLGILKQKDRGVVHRMGVDMAAGCCDIAKAIHHKFRLAVIDGIQGSEGSTHYGLVNNPGVILASPDMVAIEAVAHTIAGYHPFESPAVQIAMKDGLGTGELSEIDILGARLQDVYYPFVRSMNRFVQKYMNVKEYFGGTCNGCLMGQLGVPPLVEPDKKYAVICGTRALIANPLEGVDEAWLVGECACRADHQFPGFMDKVKAAKKIIKLGKCPGHESLYHGAYGGIYDTPMLASVDMAVSTYLPEVTRQNVVARTDARREGRETKLRKSAKH
ncbi:MAG: DUF362 domain-containing protein [Dehalococcoidia bacterium]|nr:DUF362 domain-containing protein [Dehalococcoidia bacterium]